jgi:ribose transport system permease protein
MGKVVVNEERLSVGKFVLKYNTYIMFLLLFIICTLMSPQFLTWRNIGNLIRQNAGTTFMVMGLLLVILTGGIDLSVGSLVAVGSVFTAFFSTTIGLPILLSVVLAITIGAVLGMLTGILVAYGKMAPFVASLAMMTMARGFVLFVAKGAPILLPKESIQWIATYKVLSATPRMASTIGEITPLLGVFLLAVVVIVWFVLRYTPYGRLVYGVGSNETAVRLAGINVRRIKMSVYMLSGLFCGIAGVLSATRSKVGAPVLGTGWELNAIAACVIGGVSLSGGKGSAIKALVGVFVLALIGNIMNLTAIPSYPQDIIKGAIIIIAVMLQTTSFRDE